LFEIGFIVNLCELKFVIHYFIITQFVMELRETNCAYLLVWLCFKLNTLQVLLPKICFIGKE